MLKEFKLPDLGEGIHEGEIIEVLVSIGDAVEDGQPVMVIETDKATAEVPSPVTGVVKEIKVKAGDTVKVGEVLIAFTVEEEKPSAEKKEPERPGKKEEGVGAARAAVVEEKEAQEARKPEKREAPPAVSADRERPVPASPSTRHLARELGVNLRDVSPTGPAGQVTPDDVRAFAEEIKKAPEVAKKPPVEKVPGVPPAAEAPSFPDFSQWGAVERVPLRSVRRATAKHMTLAWSQIPHVTHSDVADITELEAFRRKHKVEIASEGGALSLTVFALKAVVAALKEHPRFNSSLDTGNEEIILKSYYHIGVAVDTERGLIVPVVRDVNRKSIMELSKELETIVQRAREGKISREELVGGSFTITNVGPLGGTGFTPIVNYPQVGILGMGQARMQPVVRGDEKTFEIVPRLLLPLVICFDHRVVDGADAARFLNMVIRLLEDKEKLLMTI